MKMPSATSTVLHRQILCIKKFLWSVVFWRTRGECVDDTDQWWRN